MNQRSRRVMSLCSLPVRLRIHDAQTIGQSPVKAGMAIRARSVVFDSDVKIIHAFAGDMNRAVVFHPEAYGQTYASAVLAGLHLRLLLRKTTRDGSTHF